MDLSVLHDNRKAISLYERVGWTKSGIIPNYALWPQGGFCDTTVFYKQIPGA